MAAQTEAQLREQEEGQDQVNDQLGSSSNRPVPESFAVGDSLDWDSPRIRVHLVAELPFWIMTSTALISLDFEGALFKTMIADGDQEVFAFEVTDNRRSCGYQGNNPSAFEARGDLQALAPFMRRKQRSTIYFEALVPEGIEAALIGPDHRVAGFYFASLCEAHIPIINEVVRRYRLLTYDYFAYEVAAWDVPVWHIRGGRLGHVAVPLFDYMSIAGRPLIYPLVSSPGTAGSPLELANGEQLEQAATLVGSPGESDLLDARNLMERGDYSGAIRRTTTAIEVLVEHVLRVELSKRFDQQTVERKLTDSRNDFPGRLRQWQRLSGNKLQANRTDSLDRTRQLRHEIVHGGRRLTYKDRGLAQELVDKGRWTFNAIEGNPDRRDLREKHNVVRSMLRPTLAFRFPVVLTPDGFEVRSLRSEIGRMP